jgi:putative transposase
MPNLIAKLIFELIKLIFRDRTDLVLENIALRHQLAVLERNNNKPKLKKSDRFFWTWLSRIWPGWKLPLILVTPQTVIKWQRKGFILYWRNKSRYKISRPRIPKELRMLIRQMCIENPYWGAPRIHSELLLLG